MSTVEKEKQEKSLEENTKTCSLENKDKAALATKVEIIKQAEAAKEKKSGGCGCG
jgi:hypothetical protein